jgi:hypothetical protein
MRSVRENFFDDFPDAFRKPFWPASWLNAEAKPVTN